jgi:hypothetical protein
MRRRTPWVSGGWRLEVKTIATAIAALALSAAPAVLAQSQPYAQSPPDEGYQGYQGYGDQARPPQPPPPQDQSQGYPSAAPAQGGPGYQSPGYQGQSYPGPGYQGQAYPPANAGGPPPPAYGQAPPYPNDQNAQDARNYDRSEDAYEQRMRDYQRERREYDRQRAAYDAQFGGQDASAYAPAPPVPPPPPPPPSGAWREAGQGYYHYGDTVPFREGPWDNDERDAGWYRDHGCRLASPYDQPNRLVPVCPDGQGVYRPG